MALDPERIRDRAACIRTQLAALSALAASTDAERFAADPLMAPAARYRLQTAIEALIDLAFHLCAKRLQYPPRDAQDAFDRLTAAGILPAEGATRRREMLRFRNRVVHGYLDVDDRKVFAVVSGDLGDIADTLSAIEGAAGQALNGDPEGGTAGHR